MENLKEVVIVSGVRLPVGSFGGSLKDISAIDMGAMVVKEAVKRAGIEPSDVDETIVGQVGQIAECGFVARAVSLKAGLPETTCAYSVNRQCGSGLQAIADAVMEIQTGFADVVVAAGTENISQLPYYVKDARWGARMGHKVFEDGVIDILTWPLGPYHNGVTAENVAEKYNVTRQEQDQYALESHLRAAAAIEAGKFKDEILPVELKDRKGNITVFDTDEGPRASQTIEKLERLKPCFVKGGTVTAGNSSSLNDGAAAVVVSVVQGLTVSAATGGLFYGIIMHIIATSTMVMVVCSVYRIRHTKSGAVLGLFLATLARGLVMLPANHFITPLFMGQPVEVVDSLLLPGILPFNLLVGTINSTVTFLVYKTVSRHVIHGEGWSKKSAPAESEA